MVRFDLRSLAVLSAALASSLAVGLWMTALEKDQAHAGAAPTAFPAVAAVAPQSAEDVAFVSAPVARGADGHYWAEARIGDSSLRLLVDTGASVVTLTQKDAERLNLGLKPSDYTRTIRTASGSSRAAPVRLSAVNVGGVRLENVEALVVDADLPFSLLGMSYLGRLSGFEAAPQGLTLKL